MSTTTEKLWEAKHTLPELLLADISDFTVFLRLKRGPTEHVAASLRLSNLCGGLKGSLRFNADPLAIQWQLRDV